MTQHADILEQHFHELTGISLQELLAPFEGDNPCGIDLDENGVHHQIEQYRKSDDNSTPQGDWQHNLQTANWEKVSELCLDALQNKSKDLEVAIWLLEAKLHQFGFSAIGPCIYLIECLLKKFWDHLYPVVPEDDPDGVDYRVNLIRWLNKLTPVIAMLPITLTRSEVMYSWADWEMSARHEQLPAQQQKELGDELIQSSSIVTAIIATPIEFYQQSLSYIQLALESIESFSAKADAQFGDKSPSLSELHTLLSNINEMVFSHVQNRFVDNDVAEPEDPAGQDAQSQNSNGGKSGAIRNRNDAYARLAEAAEYIAMDDPHSPVPYLVYKAIDWGQLNTAELYQELFVQYQGQLNIFEILGLDISQTKKPNNR